MTVSNIIERTALMLAILLGTVALGACGNKGPLYLPPPPVEQQTVPQEQIPQEQVPGEQLPDEQALPEQTFDGEAHLQDVPLEQDTP